MTAILTFPPDEVLALRKRLGLSQTQFCDRYAIEIATWLGWEHGRRKVRGTSAVYLRMIQFDPNGIATRVAQARKAEP